MYFTHLPVSQSTEQCLAVGAQQIFIIRMSVTMKVVK